MLVEAVMGEAIRVRAVVISRADMAAAISRAKEEHTVDMHRRLDKVVAIHHRADTGLRRPLIYRQAYRRIYIDFFKW